jgi:hypothetical protein
VNANDEKLDRIEKADASQGERLRRVEQGLEKQGERLERIEHQLLDDRRLFLAKLNEGFAPLKELKDFVDRLADKRGHRLDELERRVGVTRSSASDSAPAPPPEHDPH